MKSLLKDLLGKDPNVKFAYLFGSYAEGSMHEKSDVDLAIFFHDDSLENRLTLHHAIQKALKKEIDLVDLNCIKNLYLLESILRHGILLKDHEDRPFYEVQKLHDIIDFKVFQNMIRAA